MAKEQYFTGKLMFENSVGTEKCLLYSFVIVSYYSIRKGNACKYF